MSESPKDAVELFEVRIPRALAADPERASEVDAVYCFKISGPNGGEWTVDLTSEPPRVISGDAGGAQYTVEIGSEDFGTMLGSPQLGMELYFQGKLKVSGDPLLASKLEEFFALVRDHARPDAEKGGDASEGEEQAPPDPA